MKASSNMITRIVSGTAVLCLSSVSTAARAQAVTATTVTATQKITSGTTGWLETIDPATESVAQTQSMSRDGRIGLIGASRTSDNPEPQASGDTFGIGAYAFNDKTDYLRTSYAGYFEARRSSGAGVTHGIEINTLNGGTAVSDLDPYTNSTSASIGLHLSAGITGSGYNAPVSAAINIITNGSKFRRGIICHAGSLQDQTSPAFANYDCLAMPLSYYVSWYSGPGNRIVAIGAANGAFRVDSPGIEVPLIAAGSIASPPAGNVRLFIDSADGKLKRKDASGTVTKIG